MIVKAKIGGKSFKKVKRKGEKVKLSLLFFVFLVCFAGNLFAQNLDYLADIIKNGSTEEKRDALFQIRSLQTVEASQIVIPALRDSNEIVRATATNSVIFLPPNEAVQHLLPLLKDKSIFVRKETAYALGQIRNARAIQPLLEVFNRDKNLEVKMASAVALGEIGNVSAIDELLKVLQKKSKDNEIFLRRASARAIGQIIQIQHIGSNYVVASEKFPVFKQVIPVLVSILQNQKEDEDTRREAAFALGIIGDKSAIAVLQQNLNAKDYYLAEICMEAIKKINSAN